MISFVNAKINIGLNVVGKRADGYHLLETCFVPVGLHNGTPDNPEPFCDILELADSPATTLPGSYSSMGISYLFSGNKTDCPPEKNLVVRAGELFCNEYLAVSGKSIPEATGGLTLLLDKHIPDGAGLGGGSADATFSLRLLNGRLGSPFSDDKLEEMAIRLGADCPVFVRNRPVFAEGIGEIFSPVESEGIRDLAERPWWIALVKPDLHISTREAFAGLSPACPALSLRDALRRPIVEWRDCVVNDFEGSLFPLYPELARLKQELYLHGATYASMTGSGAALYGLFPDAESARKACAEIEAPYRTVCRL